MVTRVFECKVTALSSIAHNGGEKNGITSQLRREKFIQPNGKPAKVPVISGNAIRGILRDAGMYSMLRALGYGIEQDGKVTGLPLSAFYFLFSGGALTSTGADGIDIDNFRQLKRLIPLIGVFGGAAGNAIMPGKLEIGKMLPICQETAHLLPADATQDIELQSVWEYCQEEMYTRRDDAKNDLLLPMLQQKQLAANSSLFGDDDEPIKDVQKSGPQQMMYNVETLAAGTQFYWKIALKDPTDIEFEAFASALLEFSKKPNIGGKAAVGHGEISIKIGKWFDIDSRAHLDGREVDTPLMEKYNKHLLENQEEIKGFLNSFA